MLRVNQDYKFRALQFSSIIPSIESLLQHMEHTWQTSAPWYANALTPVAQLLDSPLAAPVAVLGMEQRFLPVAVRADSTYGFTLRRCSVGELAAFSIAADARSMDTTPASWRGITELCV